MNFSPCNNCPVNKCETCVVTTGNYSEAHEHISRNMLDEFSKPIALVAIEKQIPKKPKNRIIDYITFDICPVCDNILSNPMDEYKYNYCKCCGQRINWSEYDN